MPADGKWEDRHRRVTFYCPAELLDLLENEAIRTERGKSELIVLALRQCLGPSGTSVRKD
ncbi:MAG: ribbon-helix-helix domain-containing protein [Acidimicrobiales bacterium]